VYNSLRRKVVGIDRELIFRAGIIKALHSESNIIILKGEKEFIGFKTENKKDC
jgi:hypothetical protein